MSCRLAMPRAPVRSLRPPNIRSFATVPALGIAAGGYHSCAVMSDGTAMCWGDNRNQQVTTGAFASTHTAHNRG